MIARVAGHRQPPALDGVGEHDAGPAGFAVARTERVKQRAQVMPGKISHETGQLAVTGQASAELPDIIRRTVKKPGFNGAFGKQPEQRLVMLVRHLIDPRPQRVSARAREGRLQPAAVLRLLDVPARGAELLLPLGDPDPGHDPVQRLPVHVDDPHHAAEAVGGRVGDGLPDVALVQLGVADQRHEPAARPGPEVRVDVPAAPSPTEPVEKSTVSGSLVRLG